LAWSRIGRAYKTQAGIKKVGRLIL
jgi:hypothetical protein